MISFVLAAELHLLLCLPKTAFLYPIHGILFSFSFFTYLFSFLRTKLAPDSKLNEYVQAGRQEKSHLSIGLSQLQGLQGTELSFHLEEIKQKSTNIILILMFTWEAFWESLENMEWIRDTIKTISIL